MSSPSNRLRSLYANVERGVTPVARIVTRIAFGQAFAITGWGKWQHLDKVVEFFRGIGIPAPEIQAPFIATLELVGGYCLLLGLATRPMALLLSCTMVVALMTADAEGLGKALALDQSFADVAPVPFLVAMLWLIAKGAGKASLDHLIARRVGGS